MGIIVESELDGGRRRCALVTGGAMRVGAAIVEQLAQNGWNVVIHFNRSRKPAEVLAEDCKVMGVDAIIVQGDLSDPTEIKEIHKATVEKFGGLDLLVNSASIFRFISLDEMTQGEWLEMMQVNAGAPLLLSKLFAETLDARNGSIVNIVDVSAERPWGGASHYCASKAALASLTKSLASELAPAIRVNGVAPGPILFPKWFDESQKNKVLSKVLLEKIGEPKDIAEAVLFLAEARFITGEVLNVDGGYSLHW